MKRLGFLLTEEETDKVRIIMEYQNSHPELFLTQCINTMWEALQNG